MVRKGKMKNPPDFVMYVVMVKTQKGFSPQWNDPHGTLCAIGYAKKSDAVRMARLHRQFSGRASAYVQQYGPYS